MFKISLGSTDSKPKKPLSKLSEEEIQNKLLLNWKEFNAEHIKKLLKENKPKKPTGDSKPDLPDVFNWQLSKNGMCKPGFFKITGVSPDVSPDVYNCLRCGHVWEDDLNFDGIKIWKDNKCEPKSCKQGYTLINQPQIAYGATSDAKSAFSTCYEKTCVPSICKK